MNKGIENVSDVCTFSVADNSRNVLKNIPIDNMNKLEKDLFFLANKSKVL